MLDILRQQFWNALSKEVQDGPNSSPGLHKHACTYSHARAYPFKVTSTYENASLISHWYMFVKNASAPSAYQPSQWVCGGNWLGSTEICHWASLSRDSSFGFIWHLFVRRNCLETSTLQSISMSHVYPSTSQLPNFTVSNAVAICFRQPMLCRFQTYAAGMFGFMKMHRTLVWLHSWGNTWDHEMASRYDQWLSPTNSPHRPCGHQNSSCTTTWCVEMGSHPVVMA